MIMRFPLLLAVIVELKLWNTIAYANCNFSPATTELVKFHNHVLKRRTRAVLFPNKASLLLTPAFTKAVLDGRPRGLAYSIEFDMYSPLPDTIEGWKPTILVNKIKQEKSLEDYQKLKEAAAEAALVAQTSSSTEKSNIDNSTYSEYDPSYYNFPFYETEVFDNWNHFQSKWGNDPTYLIRNLKTTHIKKFSKLDKISNQFHKKPYLEKNKGRRHFRTHNRNFNYDGKWLPNGPLEVSYQRTKKLPEWHRDQNYRERRHIFDQLGAVGKVFNFNMKACIQRAMCEITSHLKPYGESLMEDIIRLILTIPSSSVNYNDDYIQNYVRKNCEKHFSISCPQKVIEFLTRNLRSNMGQRSH